VIWVGGYVALACAFLYVWSSVCVFNRLAPKPWER
jgi:hypothetical protein